MDDNNRESLERFKSTRPKLNLVSEYKAEVKHWMLIVSDMWRCHPSFDLRS